MVLVSPVFPCLLNRPAVCIGDAYDCPYGDIAEDGSINGSYDEEESEPILDDNDIWPLYDGIFDVKAEGVYVMVVVLASSPAAIASLINSIDCSSAIGEYQHESRISRPSVMLGRMESSELILSMVIRDASIL